MQFQAAVLTKTGHPLEIIDNVRVPRLQRGQVLVKMAFAGICHSQLMEQKGLRGEDRYLPHMLGHEGTAFVVDCGPGVSKVTPGDKVVLGWIKGAGLDAPSTRYDSPIGSINAGGVTTFSQYSVVSENRCYLLPANVNMEEGVLLGCALPTGMGIVKNQVKPSADSTLGIMGLGGIGMSALMAAATLPHKRLIAIDTNPGKLDIARRIGAHLCVNPKEQDLMQVISRETQGNMLDYVVEAAGKVETIETAFSLVNANHGHCIFASHPANGEKIRIDPHELICGKCISGSWGGASEPEDICQFVSERKEALDLKPFLTRRYALEDINQGFDDLEQQKVLRAILAISPDIV